MEEDSSALETKGTKEAGRFPLKAEQLQALLIKKRYIQSAASHRGIWIPLLGENYEEAVSHAACSARNLIDCASKEIAGLGGETGFDAYSKVAQLETTWNSVTIPDPLEQEDFSIPVKVINAIRKFFQDFASRQTRLTRIDQTVPTTDSSGAQIPDAERKNLIKELAQLNTDFSNILHQVKNVTPDELRGMVERLEDILMAYILRIEPVENLDLIDQLIEKVETG